MFSWVELLLARTLTSVNAKPIVATMTRTVSASGMDWATLAAAGRAHDRAGCDRDLVRAALHRERVSRWGAFEGRAQETRRKRHVRLDGLDHPGGRFLHLHRAHARRHDRVGAQVAHHVCAAAGCRWPPRAATGSSSGCSSAAYVNLIFIGLAGKFQEWLRLEAEPSIWISFVLSMGLLALVMRKG
jgi:hypothetical protein